MNAQDPFNRETKQFFTRVFRLGVRRIFISGGLLRGIRNALQLAFLAGHQMIRSRKRAAAASLGRTVPGILIASVTRECNLNCEGCYSRTLRPGSSRELSDDRFMELFTQASEMGTATILIAGGEPLLRLSLLRRAAEIPGVIMPVFTNGSLLEGEALDLLSRGNLIPILSLEGNTDFTDQRRGEGVHGLVLRRAMELNRRGALFGLSLTLTSENADFILSDAFLSRAAGLGAWVLFLVEYVPVTPGTEGLVITPEQKAELLRPGRFDAYPFLTVSLPGDEEAFGGCLAAGRGFIHLADDGALEACPFAPFSDTSAAEKSLAEALDSPLMRAIREHHGELTETSGGCALWNKRGWAASLGACVLRGTPVEGQPLQAAETEPARP